MKRQVAFDVFYPHPPERVWKALTDPEALRQWLMPTDFRPRLGHRFRFQQPAGPGEPLTVCCEVVAIEEPHRLAYTWRSEQEETPTLVTWTLEPIEGGTRLHLAHEGLEDLTMSATALEARTNWGMALQGTLPSQLRRRPAARSWRRSRPHGRIVLATEMERVRCVGRLPIGFEAGKERGS